MTQIIQPGAAAPRVARHGPLRFWADRGRVRWVHEETGKTGSWDIHTAKKRVRALGASKRYLDKSAQLPFRTLAERWSEGLDDIAQVVRNAEKQAKDRAAMASRVRRRKRRGRR